MQLLDLQLGVSPYFAALFWLAIIVAIGAFIFIILKFIRSGRELENKKLKSQVEKLSQEKEVRTL